MTQRSIVRALSTAAVLTLSIGAGASSAEPPPLPDSRSVGAVVASVEWRTPQDVEGKALYLENCRACHGVVGVPTKQAAKKYEKIPNLTDPAFWVRRSDDSVMVVLRKGVGRDMKSFSEKLSTAEIVAVTKYVRTLVRVP